MQMRGGYITWISIAKAIGICLVVIGHSGAPEFLVKYIYSFHMPLFFILSGYNFKGITSLEQYKRFCVKKIKGLWVPFVSYSIPAIICHNLLMPYGFDSGNPYDWKDYISHFLSLFVFKGEPAGYFPAFWFLRALFLSSVLIGGMSLLLYKVRIKNNPLNEVLPICLFGFMILVLSLCDDIVIIKVTAISTLFIAVGIVYRKYVEERITHHTVMFVISTIIIAVCSQIFEFVEINEVTNVYFMDYLTIACIGTLSVVSLAKIADYKIGGIVNKILVYIGNHTMIILALHAVIFKILNNVIQPIIFAPAESINGLHLSSYCPHLWLIYSLCGIIVPISLSLMFREISRKLLKLKI